jgi:hypothetical protein
VHPNQVSTFPRQFATELAYRFIGPEPDKSDELIAEFLETT